MRILIVKDEVTIREGPVRLIKSHIGRTTIGEAPNGQGGLSLAPRFKSGLTITDIRTPVMDGPQVIETLHGISLSIRTVILSGYSEFDYAKRTIHFDVDDYLLEPLAVGDTVDLLERTQRKMKAEEQKNADTPGRCIKELIYNGPLSGKEGRRMRTVCGSGAFVHFQLYLGYTEDASIGYEEEIGGKSDQIRALPSSTRPHVLWDRGRRQFLGLVALPKGEGVSCLLCQAVEREIMWPYK